jgi:hypothetical protein
MEHEYGMGFDMDEEEEELNDYDDDGEGFDEHDPPMPGTRPGALDGGGGHWGWQDPAPRSRGSRWPPLRGKLT